MAAHSPFSYLSSAPLQRPVGKWDEFKSVELRQQTELITTSIGSPSETTRLELNDGRRTTFYFLPKNERLVLSSSSASSSILPPIAAIPSSQERLDLSQDEGEELVLEVRLSHLRISDQCQLQILHEAADAPLISLQQRDLLADSGNAVEFATQLRVIRAELALGVQLTVIFQPTAACIQHESTREQLLLDIGAILARPVVASELADSSSDCSSEWTRRLVCSPSGVFLQASRTVELSNEKLGATTGFTIKVRAAIGLQSLTSVYSDNSGNAVEEEQEEGSGDVRAAKEAAAAALMRQVRWLYPRLEENVELQYTTMRNNQLKLSVAQRKAFKSYPMKRLFRVQWRSYFGGASQYRVVVCAPNKASRLGIPLAQGLHISVAIQLLVHCTMQTRLFASESDFYATVKNGFDFAQGVAASLSSLSFQPPALTADQTMRLHRQRTELLSLAQRRTNFDDLRDMPLVYQSGVDLQNRPVVVAQLPAIERQAHLLHLLYSFGTIAEQPFNLLLCLADTPSSLRPSNFELLDIYRLLPSSFRKNCIQLVLLDPPLWVRKLVQDFHTICRGQARKLRIVSRPEELCKVADIDADQLHLPSRYYPHTTTAVFGEPLPVDRPAAFIAACINALEADSTAIHTEGLFRISASHQAITTAISQCTTSSLLPSSALNDPHLLANLLKRYLHALPDSLVPRPVFLSLCQLDEADIHWPSRATEVLLELPAANAQTLNQLVPFLKRVEQCRENLMSAQALGTCIGPALCDISSLDILELRSSNTIVENLLAFCDTIFPLSVSPATHTSVIDLAPASSSSEMPSSGSSLPTDAETWTVENAGSDTVSLKLATTKVFLRADKRSAIVNSTTKRKEWERWKIFEVGSGRVTIQSAHGTWLNSSPEGHPTQVSLSSSKECPPLWSRVVVDDSKRKFAFCNSSGHFLKL